MVGQLFLVHADAVVGDDDGPGFIVDVDRDLGIEGYGFEGIVRNAEVTEFVDGVGGVGDELPQEDFLVRVEGMGDEFEQLGYFGLESVFRHTYLS